MNGAARGQVVAITGASSGIGRALALAWAKRGASLVLSARNEVMLAKVAKEVAAAGGEAFVEPGDVTREADRARIISRAKTEKGRLDVLVNNAGRGYYGSSRTIAIDELEDIFRLNVFAPLRLAQLAIDPLTRTSGTIVMLSSIAGVVAAPRLGAYAASKFALEALSMSLRAELSSTGVKVVVIRPGPVDTPFRANSITTDGQPGVRPPGAEIQTPERVAELTVRAVLRGSPVVETTRFVKLASFTSRTFPSAFRLINRVLAAKPD
jgi:short-subunit dehydrogenase